jgi:hypothetical protein
VPQVGLEPTRISPLASKTSVATITPPGQKLLVPDVGIELTTYRLQGGCSTTELIRHISIIAVYLFLVNYYLLFLARRTGLEPATLGVTGQYSKPTELPPQIGFRSDQLSFSRTHWLVSIEGVYLDLMLLLVCQSQE